MAGAAGIAARQHNVVARRQLIEAGVRSSTLESWRRRGFIRQVLRGVYAVGRSALTPEGRWMAATLAAGPRSLLSHTDAAQLHHLLKRAGSGPVHVPSLGARDARSRA